MVGQCEYCFCFTPVHNSESQNKDCNSPANSGCNDLEVNIVLAGSEYPNF